jgi:hypothetical protein
LRPDHIDSPLDYKSLWAQLKIRIRAEANAQAERCATQKDMDLVRRGQGAFEFANTMLAIMNELVERGRSLEHPEAEDPANYS